MEEGIQIKKNATDDTMKITLLHRNTAFKNPLKNKSIENSKRVNVRIFQRTKKYHEIEFNWEDSHLGEHFIRSHLQHTGIHK